MVGITFVVVYLVVQGRLHFQLKNIQTYIRYIENMLQSPIDLPEQIMSTFASCGVFVCVLACAFSIKNNLDVHSLH